MEQQLGEPEGEPQLDEYAQIEIEQHRLPEGYFSTSKQMLAEILGTMSTEQARITDWG